MSSVRLACSVTQSGVSPSLPEKAVPMLGTIHLPRAVFGSPAAAIPAARTRLTATRVGSSLRIIMTDAPRWRRLHGFEDTDRAGHPGSPDATVPVRVLGEVLLMV